MNHTLAYQRLIAKACARVCPNGYVERHHILPKSLGGSDDSSNLVSLTSREHFIAHMLLAKMHGGPMWLALVIMKGGNNRYVNSRFFALAREKAPFEREKAIAQKRLTDPVFDKYMNEVRSLATQHRGEGYQIAAGANFAVKFASDKDYALKISANRKRAKAASTAAIYARDADRVRLVRSMRAAGVAYLGIREKTGFQISVISGILNGKQYIGVGELQHA